MAACTFRFCCAPDALLSQLPTLSLVAGVAVREGDCVGVPGGRG